MSKGKRIIVTIVVILVIAALITGGIIIYLWRQKSSLTAEVQSVSNLNWYYSGEEMRSYGRVTNDFYQDVYLIQNQTISEIFVEEGQEVKVGDPLIAYDTTLSSLQLEIKALDVETLENKLILARRELEKLKKETPIPDRETTVPDPEPEPAPETVLGPEPIVDVPMQKDEATGAYYYISGDLDTALAKSSGTGTLEDSYVILCMPGCYVEGAYLNALAHSGEQMFVRLQIIQPLTNAADPDKFWEINSHQFNGMTFAEDAKWSVETKQPVVEEPEDFYVDPDVEFPPEPEITEPEEPQGYTAAELAAAIKKAEKDIKDYDLQIRKAQLELEQMQKVSGDGVVAATVDGIVKTVGDKDNPPLDGSPFLTVSGSEGLYVTGSLSELQLGEVEVGQSVYANSWESGMSFEATIQEISPYPTENNNSWGEGNPNVSFYPYTAYIADTQGLKNGEYVDLTMTPSQSGAEANNIYLQKAYVREEDGKSYVLLADENNRLKKQYVETGKTIYGEAIEIKSGLNMEDRIAFPYGKTAKEGVKVKEDASSGIMY